jgi:cysteine desulfurase
LTTFLYVTAGFAKRAGKLFAKAVIKKDNREVNNVKGGILWKSGSVRHAVTSMIRRQETLIPEWLPERLLSRFLTIGHAQSAEWEKICLRRYKKKESMEKIYFDNQSNTKIDERIFNAMKPYFFEDYGNPQSIYALGSVSKDAVEKARKEVAALIGAKPDEIIFTSCGTESNNLAVKGIVQAYKSSGKHIIVSSVEHFSVINPAKRLEKEGFDVTYLPVDKEGFVNEEELKKALRNDTVLVSIQHANSEVGTIQNIKKLAEIVKNYSKPGHFIAFHTDATASCGKIPVNAADMGVDALTIAASVMYGPKGAAALYLKKGVRIVPLLEGGVQENSRRAGTENVPAIVGFGAACYIAKEEMPKIVDATVQFRDMLIAELPKRIEHIYLNGPKENRLPGNVNFSIEFVEGEALFLMLDAKGIMAASGSACANKNLKISQVLTAMNVDVAVGQGSLLFTLSKFNNIKEINYVLDVLPEIVKKLRDMSPLYSHFLKTGERMKAGPGTDYDDHGHEHAGDECGIE